MKRFLNGLPKRLTASLLALVMLVGMTSTAFAAFGPSRPTRQWTPAENGFDHVTFNSFTGVPNGIGDEREFFRGVVVGRDSAWGDPVRNVEQDATVEAKIYIHNGADPLLNDQPGRPGIARNVRARVQLPTGYGATRQATAYISADNAQPREVFDTLDITGAHQEAFEIAYIPGSARLHKNGQVTNLSDDLFGANGANLGDIRGCFEYIQEITFRMKVKMPRYTVKKMVRFEGQTKNDWKESLDVRPGQVVEWKVEFDNTGASLLRDVAILDVVPEHLTVVPGSVKLIDGNFPNGYIYKDHEAIQANGRHVNVGIGNVNPGINAIVAFKTKVNDDEALKCKTTTLVNTGYATPKDRGSIKDTAQVVVKSDQCVQPATTTELPKTGAGSVAGIFAATTLAGAAAHRYWRGRRA